MTLRVAINAITDLTPKFGSRVYLQYLTKELSLIDKAELLILVGQGSAKDLPEELRPSALEIEVEARRSYWQVLSQFSIGRILRANKADIYHLPNSLPLLWRTVPTVVTIHDLAELRVPKYGVVRTCYRWAVNLLSAHLSNLVITDSINSKADIVDLLRVPEEKIAVIYLGVDPCFRVLDRESAGRAVHSRYGIQKRYILSSGGLSKNKNIPMLLAAFEQVRRSNPDLLLVITGEGNSAVVEAIRQEIQRLGLLESVIMTGYVAPTDLPALYNAAEMLLYPSLYEGFGLPVLESMACGTPVVTSNTSSIPEVAGDAGLLVDPRDMNAIVGAVDSILHNHALRADLRARGLERAAQFTWRNTAEQTFLEYRRVVERTT